MTTLIGWFLLVCGVLAGLAGFVVMVKVMCMAIAASWDDVDDTMMHVLSGLMGVMVGGLSCAGLISLGTHLLGWS